MNQDYLEAKAEAAFDDYVLATNMYEPFDLCRLDRKSFIIGYKKCYINLLIDAIAKIPLDNESD